MASKFPRFEVALCREIGAELYFAVGAQYTGEHRQAKALCHRCPSEDQCLSWAIENSESGIWGGMTEKERRRYKAKLDSKMRESRVA